MRNWRSLMRSSGILLTLFVLIYGGICFAADKNNIVVALTEEPDYLSTCEHDSLMGVQMNLLTYNGLLRIDMKTLQPVCDLAESYSQASDNEWIFKLRNGVKFHNGDDFTAEDVVASINYAKTFPASTTYTGDIAAVEILDPLTVRVVTKSPTPNLPFNLAYHYNFILPKKLIESKNDFSSNPVGTGPYMLDKWNKGNKISFKAFSDYFDADRKAKVPTLQFVIIPEGSTRTMALESGEVDFVYAVALSDVSRLKDTDGIKVEQIVSVENFFLYLNCLNTPYADDNLRKAVAWGINREDIVAGALNGFGTPSYSTVSMGYAESTAKNGYGYDLNKAKEYIAAWGGDPAKATLDIICSNDVKSSIATIMQAELSQIGIPVTINKMDSPSYQAAMRTTKLTSAIVSWSPANAMTYVQRFHSNRRQQTPTSYVNPVLDELVMKMNSTMDDDARASIVKQLIETANEHCVFVPIYQVNYFRAHNSGLKDVVCSATGYVDFPLMSWR